MKSSNLPSVPDTKSVKTFFSSNLNQEITFPSNQVDAVVGFFINRGFDEISANATAVVLLTRAKVGDTDVFVLLDSLKGLTDLQLSSTVAAVLNHNRVHTSVLGYRLPDSSNYSELRNILV